MYQEDHPIAKNSRQKFLDLILEIEKEWGSPDSGNYVNDFQQGKSFYQGYKPRWESLHNVQAIAELYNIFGDEKPYRKAFIQIWNSIVNGDIHITGGFSSGEQATGNPYDPRTIETCATIAWMALTVDMLHLTGDSLVADELEHSFWNAILAAQSEDGYWWTYTTPMGGIPVDGMACCLAPGFKPPLNIVPPFDGKRNPSTYNAFIDRNPEKDDLGWQAKAGTPQLSCLCC